MAMISGKYGAQGPVPTDQQMRPDMKGRTGYPDASQMPEVNTPDVAPGDVPEDMKDVNPVISALQTLQQYVAALEQKGDPNAASVKDGMIALVRAVAGSVGAAGAEPTQPGQPGMPGKASQPGQLASAPMESEQGSPEMEDDQEDSDEEQSTGKMAFNPFKAPGSEDMMKKKPKAMQMMAGKQKETIPLI